MVVGKLKERHYVEITTERGKSKASCSCGWSFKNKTRNEAYALAHLHIANAAVGKSNA